MTRFEIYTDEAGEYRWRLRAGNHKIIAHGEGYANLQDCLHCIDLVRDLGDKTPVEDLTE